MAGWSLSEVLGSGFEEFDHAIGCCVASITGTEGVPRHVSLGLPAVREAVEDAGLSERERTDTDVVAATAISAAADPGHILYGTDWSGAPASVVEYVTRALDEAAVLDDPTRQAINRGNALGLLPGLASRLSATPTPTTVR
jgi:hypothetical protein